MLPNIDSTALNCCNYVHTYVLRITLTFLVFNFYIIIPAVDKNNDDHFNYNNCNYSSNYCSYNSSSIVTIITRFCTDKTLTWKLWSVQYNITTYQLYVCEKMNLWNCNHPILIQESANAFNMHTWMCSVLMTTFPFKLKICSIYTTHLTVFAMHLFSVFYRWNQKFFFHAWYKKKWSTVYSMVDHDFNMRVQNYTM